MKRLLVSLLVGVFFLVPATSWSAPPFPPPTNIAEHVAALEAQVAALQTQVHTLTTTVATLQSQLSAETTNRSAADTTLQNNIDAEVSARAAADSSEATARTAGDTNTLNSAKAYTDLKIPVPDSFLTNLKTYMDVNTTSHRITFTGVNIQIVNGTGYTSNDPSGASTVNGLGNLIVGYDELVPTDALGILPVCSDGAYDEKTACESAGELWEQNHKSGSHNLIIGAWHRYSRAGGIVAGEANAITANYSTVSGGMKNVAGGLRSSICGGLSNTAIGRQSTVGGGAGNTSIGFVSTVGGGTENTASGTMSSVSGGQKNVASNSISSVNGGYENTAGGQYSTVSGGYGNTASGQYSTVSGGFGNTASGIGQHLP